MSKLMSLLRLANSSKLLEAYWRNLTFFITICPVWNFAFDVEIMDIQLVDASNRLPFA